MRSYRAKFYGPYFPLVDLSGDLRALFEASGQSKVYDINLMRVILVAEQYILGLDVTVHIASLMELLQPK